MVELEGKKTPRPSFTTCSRSRPISIAERHPCRVHRPCCRGRHRIAGRTRSVSEGMSRSGVGKSLPAVVFAGSNEHGGSMEQADQEEHFPRTIYDESGRYTISGYGQYEVRSPLIKRYAAVVYIRRDLDSALEMIRACAADEQCPGSPLAKRCLWISAVVTYAKALRGGKGRKAFDADGYVTRSEEHTSELQSLMRISYAVFCLKKKNIDKA